MRLGEQIASTCTIALMALKIAGACDPDDNCPADGGPECPRHDEHDAFRQLRLLLDAISMFRNEPEGVPV